MGTIRTQVGIVGGGPAGMLLSHMLARRGIESVVLERQSREHVIGRVRAGVLEQRTVDLLTAAGVGDRLAVEGSVQRRVELRVDGHRHFIDYSDLTGGRVTVVYPQEKIMEDLIDAAVARGRQLLFGAEATSLRDVESSRPAIGYRRDGDIGEIECDVVIGCDGSRGVCASYLRAAADATVFAREYPVAWLAVLADVPASVNELVYATSEHGLALHNTRGLRSRSHLQVDPRDCAADWPDERIWSELGIRLATADCWTLREGPISSKEIVTLRSSVIEPMQHGRRLFLAGDAAHIMPPTGAKGLNLAVADVYVLARALTCWYETGAATLLDDYSVTCLRHVWRAQRFAAWMTRLLHTMPGRSGFDQRERQDELSALTGAGPAAQLLAEGFTGAPAGDEELAWVASSM